MNIELIVLMTVVAGFLYVRYHTYTMEKALERREKMVKVVNSIVNNHEFSTEFKQMAVVMFHMSLSRNLLPKAFLASVFLRGRDKSKTREIMHSLTKSERKEYYDLIRKHAAHVNMLAAPHWYILLFVVLFFVYIASSIFMFSIMGSARFRTKVESAATTAMCKEKFCH